MFSKPRTLIVKHPGGTPPRPPTLSIRGLCALLISFSAIVSQKAGSTAVITAVDTSAFPDMRVYLALTNGAGQSVAGLPANTFTLTEDQSMISGLQVLEQEVGTQGVIVLDTSAAFKARDVNAVTRLDFLKQALTENTSWMRNGVDDVTVLAPEAALIAHSRVVSDVARAVMDYTTDYAGAANLVPFANHALDLASDTAPRPGMRRYIVFISSGFAGSGAEAAVTDLAARANASHILIYTAYVGPAGSENTVAAQSLRKLAELTGAASFIFDQPESLAPLFQRLADQRTQYLLSYRSALAVTGQHAVAATVQLPDGTTLASEASAFPLRIEPPVITLQNVPATIERVAQPGADPQTLEPAAYAVLIQTDFPDGHPRALTEAQLLVDGQVADTRRAAPIDTLGWSLASYSESRPHTLQVRATDELGLTAASEVMTVTVAVVRPPAATAEKATTSVPGWAAGIAALLSATGVVAIVWLWLARRNRLAPAPPRTAALSKTQPLIPKPRPPETKSRSTPRLPLPHLHLPAWRAARPHPVGKAYLEVIEPGGGGASRADIELTDETVRLGREASLAQIVFPDRSVSRLHARITEMSSGLFRVFDEGSTSGTWVNFTQVPAETGWELKPGDVINLGRVQLRFKRRDAPASAASEAAADTGRTEPDRPQKE